MMMLNQLCANINVVLQLNRERKQHTYMYFQWNLKFPTTNRLEYFLKLSHMKGLHINFLISYVDI